MDANDIFSFKSIRNSISQFRQVNRYDGNRIYDEPGEFFWKPIFYFYNGDDDDNSTGLGNAGLLYPSWVTNPTYVQVNVDNSKALCENTDAVNDAQLVNCAYNYLLRNNELKRAALLKNFVELLSDISSKTPWYFKEVSGLDEAVSKKSFFENPKIDENRKQITITCLADSVDTRIGNMLDMYRSACYSWQTKRIIVPANLRKFDMGIYVFLRPYQDYTKNITGNKSEITNSSHKYLEFHNCEIDLDSCKIGDTFNNEAASFIEYKIVISYDNCYDNRYSDFYVGLIGDSIMTDMIVGDDKTKDADNITDLNKNYGDTNYFESSKKSLFKNIWTNLKGNIMDSTVGMVQQTAKTLVGGALLGNLYHGSVKNSLRDIQQGRLISGSIELADTLTDPHIYEKTFKSIYSTLEAETLNNIENQANNAGQLVKKVKNINPENLGEFAEKQANDIIDTFDTFRESIEDNFNEPNEPRTSGIKNLYDPDNEAESRNNNKTSTTIATRKNLNTNKSRINNI